MDIDSLKDDEAEKVLLSLDDKLKQYCEGLDFVLGDLSSNGRTFTITANGEEEFFPRVEELMSYAPEFNLWKLEGYLQAQGKHCTEKYGKYLLKSKDLFFVPLENEENPEQVGVEIGLRNFVEDEDLKVCCFLLIEKMIGEYYAGTLVKYFDVVPLPESYEEENFLPLDDLPDYIAWHLDKNKSRD